MESIVNNATGAGGTEDNIVRSGDIAPSALLATRSCFCQYLPLTCINDSAGIQVFNREFLSFSFHFRSLPLKSHDGLRLRFRRSRFRLKGPPPTRRFERVRKFRTNRQPPAPASSRLSRHQGDQHCLRTMFPLSLGSVPLLQRVFPRPPFIRLRVSHSSIPIFSVSMDGRHFSKKYRT